MQQPTVRKDWPDGRRLMLILAAIYLLTRLPAVPYLPFIHDESIYSMMIEEQARSPTLTPTFLGYEAGWKPPLFFWAYAILTRPFLHLPIPIDVVYRLPTLLFGLLNVLLAFQLTRKIAGRNDIAFFTSLIYLSVFLVLYTDSLVMTDTMAMTFIFASMLAYLHAPERPRFFLLAGFLAFLAFFTKQVNAVVAPLFMAAWLFQHDRKALLHPLFLLSLLFIPAAFLLNYAAFHSPGQAYTVYSDLIENKIAANLNLKSLYESVGPFFLLVSMWLPLSLLGVVRFGRRDLPMALWYALMIFPVFAGTYMPFYFLPVILPIAYFSALMLMHDEKDEVRVDAFFYFGLSMMVAIGITAGAYIYVTLHDSYLPQKEAGELLAFRHSAMVVGYYAPGAIAYKALTESREYGNWLDFGWVLCDDSQETIDTFVSDYRSADSNVIDGSFAKMFFESHVYRKDTNITHFDYVAVASLKNATANGTLLYNSSSIRVYRR